MPAYVELVSRPWGRQMKANISLEKDRVKLKGNGRKIIIPLDPSERKPWSEPLDEDHEVRCLYQIINEQRDYIEPNAQGEILAESPLSIGHNSNLDLYNWQIENYEAHSKDCWTIEAIPIKHPRTCYSIQGVPIVCEKRLRQTPTLIPTDNTVKKSLRYNKRNVSSTHVEEVSKSVGEQGRIQSLVETFIGQAARWWETHSPRLQTWTIVSTYFVEHFGEKKLSKAAEIPIFKVGYDLVEHIHHFENEWCRIGYRDESVWPHMFPKTLDKIPNKWYKIEKACSHILHWFDIKENFIKDFEFISKEEHLKETSQQIKSFLEKPTPAIQKKKGR